MIFQLGPFLGSNLALHPKLLPDNVGVLSLNHRPDRGDLRPWMQPSTVATVPSGRQTIFMLGRVLPTDAIYWLTWTTIVHAVLSFIADDTTKRTYYTGSGAPKVTDNLIGLAGAPYPTSYRDLGVPKPLTVPTITQTTAGTGDDETRFYAYTYLTDWNEEGPPQVSAAVTCKPGAIFSITNLALPPTGPGETRGIDRMRIYRTVAGDTGASFFFLRDIPIATSTTDDARGVGADTLPSTKYAMPPADLSCLIALWNGMMAGISGKSVRYCEVFKPHAWPVAYETLCAEATPIALGAYEGNLVIATTGKPRIASGDSPEAMRDAPVEMIAACVSVRSMVSMGHGVLWATPDGLAYVGSAGAPRLITDGLMVKEDWQALNPSSIIGCQYKGCYFGFYDNGSGLKGFMLDPLAPAGIYFLDVGFTAAFFDPLGESMYVLEGVSIRKWDASTSPMTVTHRTKLFKMPRSMNLGCAEVIADTFPATFKVIADGVVRLTKSVLNLDAFNLPAGLYDNYQFELSTTGEVTGAVIAESMQELSST